jgi:hypothetical protein
MEMFVFVCNESTELNKYFRAHIEICSKQFMSSFQSVNPSNLSIFP